MLQNLSSAAVLIGALRVLMSNIHIYYSKQFSISYKHVCNFFIGGKYETNIHLE